MDAYYLDVRCMLIEVAATLDRYDRAKYDSNNGQIPSDPRLGQLYDTLRVLADSADGEPNRSERILNLFSDLD